MKNTVKILLVVFLSILVFIIGYIAFGIYSWYGLTNTFSPFVDGASITSLEDSDKNIVLGKINSPKIDSIQIKEVYFMNSFRDPYFDITLSISNEYLEAYEAALLENYEVAEVNISLSLSYLEKYSGKNNEENEQFVDVDNKCRVLKFKVSENTTEYVFWLQKYDAELHNIFKDYHKKEMVVFDN